MWILQRSSYFLQAFFHLYDSYEYYGTVWCSLKSSPILTFSTDLLSHHKLEPLRRSVRDCRILQILPSYSIKPSKAHLSRWPAPRSHKTDRTVCLGCLPQLRRVSHKTTNQAGNCRVMLSYTLVVSQRHFASSFIWVWLTQTVTDPNAALLGLPGSIVVQYKNSFNWRLYETISPCLPSLFWHLVQNNAKLTNVVVVGGVYSCHPPPSPRISVS